MNTYLYVKNAAKNTSPKVLSRSLVASMIAGLVAFTSVSQAQASEKATHDGELPQLVGSVLKDTEQAIALLRIDPAQSLNLVNQALDSIQNLEESFTLNTITNSEADNTYSYNHFYPQVDLTELQKDKSLPTLAYKLDSKIIYQGVDEGSNAFFDYTFAKASLVTAKEAITVEHKLEAMSNLRRVFEAIYIAPDFKVTDQPIS